jgi:hypothetical protein
MSSTMLTRKSFLVRTAAGVAALAAGSMGAAGCGGGGSDDEDTGAGPSGSGDGSGSGDDDGDDGGPGPGPGSGTDGGPGSSDDDADGGPGPGDGSSSGGEPDPDSSSGGSGETGVESVCVANVVAEIANNHGHALEIPLADIEAGVEVTYDASGTAGHCHEVTLTAEDFAMLRAGQAVIKFSCNGGDHQFVLSCGRGAPRPVDPGRACDPDPNFGTCG